MDFAHGQMSQRELEQVMYDFINGDVDVLVSTTIIETGLDISNVNTMIIHDSDRYGLSQLYQLRGRVGRSNRTAYAFLMYTKNKMLQETAEKRLSAMREYSDLGSGFKIAMKDLEIRGAGNVLGKSQHGHMAAVGYDLYCKMLNQAVNTLKGVKNEYEFETTVDMEVDAYIPATYIRSEYLKLDMYKRIAAIENGLILYPSPRQTVYPDFTLMKSEADTEKIAVDIKTTYRKFLKNGQPSGYVFTLGSFASYMRDGKKNISFPYDQYAKHYVIGFVYTRNDNASEGQMFCLLYTSPSPRDTR